MWEKLSELMANRHYFQLSWLESTGNRSGGFFIISSLKIFIDPGMFRVQLGTFNFLGKLHKIVLEDNNNST